MARFNRKKEPASLTQDSPPMAIDELTEYIAMARVHMSFKRRKMPDDIPSNNVDAAKWWMNNQRPAGHDESPRQVAAVGGGNRWECAYPLRLSNSFRQYISIPTTDRDLVMAGQDDGVWWDGDEVLKRDGGPGFYIMLCNEHGLMMKDKGAYIKRSAARMRELINKTTAEKV